MAPVKKAAVAEVVAGVNFGDDSLYVAGGGLPEGDYILFFDIRNYQAMKQNGQAAGPARLGVMVTAHPLADPHSEPKMQFYSMGGNADKSFAPDPETGKSLVAIPGAAGVTLPDSTNWNIFRKSMYDCGLPVGIFTNSVEPLDGMHVHITNIPEPEERKGFGASKTGEVEQEQKRKGTIGIVTEIKEDGKPWEGTGGLPEAKTAAPKAAGKPVAVAAKKAAPVAVAAVTEDGEDVKVAAINALGSLLEANPNGMAKLKMRTGVFSSVKASQGDDMAQAVTDAFFSDDASLNMLLGELGYKLNGQMVVVA